MPNCFPPPPAPTPEEAGGRERERGVRGVYHGRDHQRPGKRGSKISVPKPFPDCGYLFFGSGRCVPGTCWPRRGVYLDTLDMSEPELRKITSYLRPRPASGQRLAQDAGHLDPRLCSVPPFVQI
jgi:hypothetical protein